MIDKLTLDRLQAEFISNIEAVQQQYNMNLKKFKVQQAELLKNTIIDMDSPAELQMQFSKYQNELMEKEKEGNDSIKSLLQDEVNRYAQKVAEIVLGQTKNTQQVNQQAPQSVQNIEQPFNHQVERPNDGLATGRPVPPVAPVDNIKVGESLEKAIDPEAINDNQTTNNGVQAQQVQNSANSEVNDLISSITDFGELAPEKQEVIKDKKTSDIPIETKELDEWISEIKNLI